MAALTGALQRCSSLVACVMPGFQQNVEQLAFFAFNAFNFFAYAWATHQLGNQLFMSLHALPRSCAFAQFEKAVTHSLRVWGGPRLALWRGPVNKTIFFKEALQKILFTLVLHSQDNDHIATTFIAITDGVPKRAEFHLYIVLMQSVWHSLMDASTCHQTAYLYSNRCLCFFPGLWAFAFKEFS